MRNLREKVRVRFFLVLICHHKWYCVTLQTGSGDSRPFFSRALIVRFVFSGIAVFSVMPSCITHTDRNEKAHVRDALWWCSFHLSDNL